MAAVNYTRGVKLLLKVSQGGSPETFASMCTINADRGISFDATFREDAVPDCSDPDLLAWLAREAESLSMGVTGGGMVHRNDVHTLWTWWKDGESKNCQIILDADDAADVITWEGAFKLTWNMIGGRGSKVTGDITLASDGEVEATFGANVGGS